MYEETDQSSIGSEVAHSVEGKMHVPGQLSGESSECGQARPLR